MENFQMKENEGYTYADYISWEDDGNRYELIDGVVYAMSSPTLKHQIALGNLYFILRVYLKGKKCRVILSPFDVRLKPEAKGKDKTVVQPDVLVVCDSKKLKDGKACLGPPDLTIEVISPSNTKYDTQIKYKKYLESGVREYWIVDPENKTVTANRLVDKKYTPVTYTENDEAPVMVLEDFTIKLSEVFDY